MPTATAAAAGAAARVPCASTHFSSHKAHKAGEETFSIVFLMPRVAIQAEFSSPTFMTWLNWLKTHSPLFRSEKRYVELDRGGLYVLDLD